MNERESLYVGHRCTINMFTIGLYCSVLHHGINQSYHFILKLQIFDTNYLKCTQAPPFKIGWKYVFSILCPLLESSKRHKMSPTLLTLERSQGCFLSFGWSTMLCAHYRIIVHPIFVRTFDFEQNWQNEAFQMEFLLRFLLYLDMNFLHFFFKNSW